MAVIADPSVAANLARIGEVATGATGALHVVQKPIPASIGHYRVNHVCVFANSQAANSRLFEIRNPSATNLIIPTQLVLKWQINSTQTAAKESSLDVFKCTAFTAVDTTDTVSLTPSLVRTSMGATTAIVRGVTASGIAAGMTGGTLTKDASSIGQLPQWLLAAVPTASVVPFAQLDVFNDTHGTHPFVFAQNEGLIIENRVLMGAASGSSVYIDLSYAEVTAY